MDFLFLVISVGRGFCEKSEDVRPLSPKRSRGRAQLAAVFVALHVMTLSVQQWAQLENEAEAGLFSLNCPPTV